MDKLLTKLQEWIALYGLKIVGAVVILLIGRRGGEATQEFGPAPFD